MSKNWFANYYFFGNRIERPLSLAAVKEEAQGKEQKESK
jgi:hypothetical protein